MTLKISLSNLLIVYKFIWKKFLLLSYVSKLTKFKIKMIKKIQSVFTKKVFALKFLIDLCKTLNSLLEAINFVQIINISLG